jgi:predicted Rossmann-fold nucleotide-binding protein
MRVLVCGGRDYQNKARAFLTLDCLRRQGLTIICGAANGADRLAADWAFYRGVSLDLYPAEWRKHGKSAGPIRNQKMIDEGKPDLVIAFPGGRGTADMVRRAQDAGIEVREIAA